MLRKALIPLRIAPPGKIGLGSSPNFRADTSIAHNCEQNLLFTWTDKPVLFGSLRLQWHREQSHGMIQLGFWFVHVRIERINGPDELSRGGHLHGPAMMTDFAAQILRRKFHSLGPAHDQLAAAGF